LLVSWRAHDRRLVQNRCYQKERNEMTAFTTHFTQCCPVCGRPARIPVQALASEVSCRHCHASFVTQANVDAPGRLIDTTSALMRRANALLARDRHASIQPDICLTLL
jgi:hypothetical protein